MHPLHRLLVLPVAGAVLVTLPLGASADSGSNRGGRSTSSSVAATSDSSSTSVVDPATTPPPTTVVVPATQVRGGIEVTRFLNDLISKVEKSDIAADLKASLLTRLHAAVDSIKNGVLPSNTDMQSLFRDVNAAFGRAPGTDAPKPSTTVPVATSLPPGTTTPRLPESTNGGGRGKTVDTTKVLAALDELTTKVTSSSLSDGDKATLVAAIDRIRQGVNAGTFKLDDLTMLKAVVKSAVEKRAGSTPTASSTSVAPTTLAPDASAGTEADTEADDETTTTPGTEAERPRPKGHDAVNAAIDLVTNAPLSDALKQQILGVLTQAKSVLEDSTLSAEQAKEQLRQLLEAEKQQRLAEAAAKLTLFSQKIATLAFDMGTLPGAGDVIVVVHDHLAQANDLLAQQPLDIATIKSAWKHLHEARTTLQQFIESASGTTTTVAPSTTLAPATTVAPATTTAAPTTTSGDTA